MTVYCNTDASYERGMAALAYDSQTLGHHVVLVPARCSTEAEMMALRLAMVAATMAKIEQVTFRVDSTTLVRPARINAERLVPLRDNLVAFMDKHKRWKIKHVPRRKNVPANVLARKALRAYQPKPKEAAKLSTA